MLLKVVPSQLSLEPQPTKGERHVASVRKRFRRYSGANLCAQSKWNRRDRGIPISMPEDIRIRFRTLRGNRTTRQQISNGGHTCPVAHQ